MEVKEAEGIIESKEEATKKDGELYWRYKINIEGNVLTMSQWNYDDGKEVRAGQKVLVTWSEKEGTGMRGPVTYRNIASIGHKEKYAQRDPKLGSDDELTNQAPSNSIVQRKDLHKESRGGLSTNESIVRQVLYKCASELLKMGFKGTPCLAKEVNEYVKDLEKGFYE